MVDLTFADGLVEKVSKPADPAERLEREAAD